MLADEHLEACLETNTKHLGALTLLGYLRGDADRIMSVLEIAPLDAFARAAMWLMGGDALGAYTLGRPEAVLDAALDFEKAGFTGEAVKLLEACTAPNQLTFCHLAKLRGGIPAEGEMIHCHPNRLDDIAALQNGDWRSLYLLGCLYYDRMNYAAAVSAWGASATSCCRPSTWFMPMMRPRRLFISPITSPMYSSGTSTSTCMIGSRRTGLA